MLCFAIVQNVFNFIIIRNIKLTKNIKTNGWGFVNTYYILKIFSNNSFLRNVRLFGYFINNIINLMYLDNKTDCPIFKNDNFFCE